MSGTPLAIGTRVLARRLGKADVTGDITWVGPSKFGDGWRYRVAAGGKQHWASEAELTVLSAPKNNDPTAVQKGSRARVIAGAHLGVEGEVYTSSGPERFGLRDDNEDTYWVDAKNLERI